MDLQILKMLKENVLLGLSFSEEPCLWVETHVEAVHESNLKRVVALGLCNDVGSCFGNPVVRQLLLDITCLLHRVVHRLSL